MASVYHLLDDAIHTEEDIVVKYKNQDYDSKLKFFAALNIQRAYHGYVARKMVKKWHAAATIIQKVFRGWLLRYHLPDIMHEYYDQMILNLYNRSATKIQARWRGYSVRQKICIQDILREREDIMAANEKIKAAIRRRADVNEPLDPSVVEKVLKALFNRHHLLRTHQKEGIYSIRDSKELSQLEKILQSMKWKDYMMGLRKCYNIYSKKQGGYQYKYDNKELRKMEDLYRQRDTSRDIQFDIVGNGDGGKPFNTKMDKKKYERWLATTGKFSLPITKIVRTDDKLKNICDKDFDLNVLKKIVKEADVPAYYVNFWYEQCKIHNITEQE